MASDPWSIRLSSKRHPSALQSRSDLYLGFEEMDGEDDSRAEFACPFCSEDFDIVGLCCHIDDVHPVEAKNGICPVCAARVGMNMRRRSRKGSAGSHSTLSLLRKELREGHIQSLLGGSSYVHSASNTAPDPLLTSFIYSFPMADASKSAQPRTSEKGNLVKELSDERQRESAGPSLLDGEQKEKAQKCEFIQQLLLSTFLDENS
ncbi:hypothetical protein AAC387_Pa09g1395 [Persea americana]